MIHENLIELTDSGLYCSRGAFYIDPVRPVDCAVITHAHADHARPGCRRYLACSQSEPILRHRLKTDIDLQPLSYGEHLLINGVRLSLHPAGHILGSAQVRLEHRGEVWVVSGDYKTAPDPTCVPFEPVRCHTFVTESTFGLPIFRWRPQPEVFGRINDWWKGNRESGKTSLLFAYTLGKAQRLLSGIDPGIGPVFCHGAIETVNDCYRNAGVPLPPTRPVGEIKIKKHFTGSLVLAPPSADSIGWMKKFSEISRGFASGWMQVRGNRRRRSFDRGFALSDHCDWEQLNAAVKDTGASRIKVIHGYTSEFARWLKASGFDADNSLDWGHGRTGEFPHSLGTLEDPEP
jgi:putative mRNA 3-end processing factor